MGNKTKKEEEYSSLNKGYLLEDTELGECLPSFASSIVMNQSNNGWTDWKDKDGNPLDIYRKKNYD